MHFEETPEIAALVTSLLDLLTEYRRGDTVPWPAIEAIAGSRYDNRGRYVIQKWRKILQRDHDIVTLVDRTVGVRLLTDAQIVAEIPKLRELKAFRQMNHGLKQIRAVNHGNLTEHQKRVLEAHRLRMRLIRRDLRRAKNSIVESLPADTMPLRPRPPLS